MEIGLLVIITGISGSGKDAVMERFLQHPEIKKLNFKQVVSCADRLPRREETQGVQHHFVTPDRLILMEKNGELAEPITKYGISNKATPKFEIAQLLNGVNLVWRIDSSRTTEVASGIFFKNKFPEYADQLQKHTMIFVITAPKETIEERRKKRDLDKYNPMEYKIRDEQDRIYFDSLKDKVIMVNNLDGKIDEAVNFVVKSTLNFYDSVKDAETKNKESSGWRSI